MSKELFKGIFPAMITPFDNKGKLDLSALKSNIKRWNEYGLRGYLAAGSTGEAIFLSRKERLQLVETTRNTMSDGMTLVVGAGLESTAQSIKLCKDVAKAGADAALIITPSFYKSSVSVNALEKHYRDIANASPIPLLLYNVPKFTGLSLSVDTILSLAQHPNIVGLKDSSGNSQQLASIIHAVPEDFAVLTGHAPSLAQAFICGVDGAILAVANVIPEICVSLHRAAEADSFTDVKYLHNLIPPVSEVTGGAYGIGGLKHAMSLLDYTAGLPRPPLSPPTDAQAQKIQQALQEVGLLKK